MKLASFHADGRERIGFVAGDDMLADLTVAYEAYLASHGDPKATELAQALTPPEMISFIEGGPRSLEEARKAQDFVAGGRRPADPDAGRMLFQFSEVRWRPPVRRPTKIMCVALNNPEIWKNAVYIPEDHPVYFIKPTTCLIGHGEAIEIPDIGVVHPEAELAVVIGKKCKNIAQVDALDAVFGYSILDDITAATVRREDMCHIRIPMEDPKTGEWTMEEFQVTPLGRHKGHDTFAPMGPWIVTKDEIPDPNDGLEVRAWMGDELVNEDNTGYLKFHAAQCVSWVSTASTLYPGDVITLGTASSTEKWPMRKADLRKYGGPIRITIDKIGTLENPVERL